MKNKEKREGEAEQAGTSWNKAEQSKAGENRQNKVEHGRKR